MRILVAVLLFLLTLPITIPLMALDHALTTWRMRRAALRTSCPVCATILGRAGLDAVTRHTPHHQGGRSRIVRIADAACPVCGQLFRYSAGRLTAWSAVA